LSLRVEAVKTLFSATEFPSESFKFLATENLFKATDFLIKVFPVSAVEFVLLQLHSWALHDEAERDGVGLTLSWVETDFECRSAVNVDVFVMVNKHTVLSGSGRAQLHVEVARRLHVG
jgi:hypothetical protein